VGGRIGGRGGRGTCRWECCLAVRQKQYARGRRRGWEKSSWLLTGDSGTERYFDDVLNVIMRRQNTTSLYCCRSCLPVCTLVATHRLSRVADSESTSRLPPASLGSNSCSTFLVIWVSLEESSRGPSPCSTALATLDSFSTTHSYLQGGPRPIQPTQIRIIILLSVVW
jgi:hypothetical protein